MTTRQEAPRKNRRATFQRARRRGAGGVAMAFAALCLLGAVAATIVVIYLVANPVARADPARPEYAEPAPGVDPVAQAEYEQSVAQSDGEPSEPYTPPPPVAGQPLRLEIPAVGIDVSVGVMRVPDSRVVDPPTARTAYWLRDYSVLGPTATGTGYIAGHTYRGSGNAVFNALFDPQTRAARIHVGDEVKVTTPEGVTSYNVTAVDNYDKKAVVDQQAMWQDIPGRLVLVACWYNGADPATANMVIYAERVTP